MEAVYGCISWGGVGAVWLNIGKRRYTEKQKQILVDGIAKAVGMKRESWKMIEVIRDRGEQPPTGLTHPVRSEEEANQEGSGQSTEECRGITVPKA